MESRIEKALQNEEAMNKYYAEMNTIFANAQMSEEEFNRTHELALAKDSSREAIKTELLNGKMLGWSNGYGVFTVIAENDQFVMFYKGEEIDRVSRIGSFDKDLTNKDLYLI